MDLAKRAVACKRWRWMPGMLTNRAECVLSVFVDWEGLRWIKVSNGDVPGNIFPSDRLPRVDDPATVGCLLALVREAWNDPTISARYEAGADGGEWVVWLPRVGKAWERPIYGKSEAEALVAAFEAAPEKRNGD